MPSDPELGEWPVGDDPSCCRDHVLAWRELKSALAEIRSEMRDTVGLVDNVLADLHDDDRYKPDSHEPPRSGEPFTHQDRRSGGERRVAIKHHDHKPFRRSGRDRRKS